MELAIGIEPTTC